MAAPFQTGFEAGVPESTRRALFDIRRRVDRLEDRVDEGGGGGGDPGVVSFVHSQGVAVAVWNITHDLGWFPNVTVIDSTGRTVEGDLVHLTDDALRLTFTGAFTGTAYLS